MNYGDYGSRNDYYRKKRFVENFIEQYPKRNLAPRRLLAVIIMAVSIPIHLALWLPIFFTLWIPYCLLQLGHWLITGKAKDFEVKVFDYYSYYSRGISCWYYKILFTYWYRIFLIWVKGESKKEAEVIEILAQEALQELLEKEKEERRLKPIMDELNRKYPGATI